MQQQESANRNVRPNLAALTAGVRFPGEDGGQSLGAMAQRDLDAALQLLADRAQYITGSSGAAIALRRGGKNDMLCRASSGANAPELGALLSTEFGLSGESVRTRQLLRCDDAERDARVNQEACRELGIASVAVMPVVNDDEVLGVFELFSGRANAFGERDFAALRRLSEMVETAVRLARVAEALPERLSADPPAHAETVEDPEAILEVDTEVVGPVEPTTKTPDPTHAVLGQVPTAAAPDAVSAPSTLPGLQRLVPTTPEAAPKQSILPNPVSAASPEPLFPASKPLFWSIAAEDRNETELAASDANQVPAAFRNLRKCEACGFPVSAGRTYCVECEEKKWRGQLKVNSKPRTSAVASNDRTSVPPAGQRTGPTGFAAAGAAPARLPEAGPKSAPLPSKGLPVQVAHPKPGVAQPADLASLKGLLETRPLKGTETSSPELVLSAGLEPSESWFSAHKFIIIPILLIAAIAAVFALIR